MAPGPPSTIDHTAPIRKLYRRIHMLNDGLFLRSPLLFLPNILPNAFDTLFTPNLRLIGRARNNCAERASRNNDWNANDTPAKFSAADTS
jgi:hypothetical protein